MSIANAIIGNVKDTASATETNSDTSIENSERLRISIGKVVCVGRNYAAHAQQTYQKPRLQKRNKPSAA